MTVPTQTAPALGSQTTVAAKFYWIGAAVYATGLVLDLYLWILGVSLGSVVAGFVFWLIMLAPYAMLYMHAAKKGSESYRKVAEWKLAVEPPPPEKCKIPASDFPRVLSFLSEAKGTTYREDKMVRITRRHWKDLVRRIWFWVLLSGLSIIASFAVLVVKHSGSYKIGVPHFSMLGGPNLPGLTTATPTPTQPPKVTEHNLPDRVLGTPGLPSAHHVIGWWAPPLMLLVLAGIFAVVAWVRSWKWSYRYTWITNMTVAIVTAPPRLILPLLGKRLEKVYLVRIINVHHRKEGLGNNLDFGDVGLDTESNTDGDFNVIKDIPGPELWAEDLDSASLLTQMNSRGMSPEFNYQMRIPSPGLGRRSMSDTQPIPRIPPQG